MRIRKEVHEYVRQVQSASRVRQGGVTSIEYALIAALIAMVLVGTVTLLGGSVGNFFNFVSGEVAKAASSTGN